MPNPVYLGTPTLHTVEQKKPLTHLQQILFLHHPGEKSEHFKMLSRNLSDIFYSTLYSAKQERDKTRARTLYDAAHLRSRKVSPMNELRKSFGIGGGEESRW